MKKLTIILSVLFCFLFSFCVFAADGMIMLNAYGEENEIVLSVGISENSKLCTTEIYVYFDSSALEFCSGSELAGSAVESLSPYITANVVSDGKLKISYTCTEALTDGGEICKVSFKAKKDAQVQFTPEIEHAETFDGEHIRSLDFTAQGCECSVTKPSPSAAVIAVAAAGAAAVIAAAVIIIKKKTRKV